MICLIIRETISTVVFISNALAYWILMNLERLLSKKRSTILDRWLDCILDTYPADTKRFYKKQKDRFANPVGTTISKEIGNLYDELLKKSHLDRDRVSPILDRIIRIRAIQDFSPSQAISFIFMLKGIVREELKIEVREERISDELLALESKMDDLTLMAFDIHAACREKIYEIKASQAKNQVSRLLRRAGLASELPEWEEVPKGFKNSCEVTP